MRYPDSTATAAEARGVSAFLSEHCTGSHDQGLYITDTEQCEEVPYFFF